MDDRHVTLDRFTLRPYVDPELLHIVPSVIKKASEICPVPCVEISHTPKVGYQSVYTNVCVSCQMLGPSVLLESNIILKKNLFTGFEQCPAPYSTIPAVMCLITPITGCLINHA